MKWLLLFFTSSILLISCNKDNAAPIASYYVKYSVSARGGWNPYIDLITVSTEWGEEKITPQRGTSSWTQIYGPVSQGFRAQVRAVGGATEMSTQIYVCRGEEPFVIKATGESSTSYVIDF